VSVSPCCKQQTPDMGNDVGDGPVLLPIGLLPTNQSQMLG
jgi:hypothetical protein